MVKDKIDYLQLVDWSRRHVDSSKMNCTFSRAWANPRMLFSVLRERRDRRGPEGALATKGAHRTPREPLVPGAEINGRVKQKK